MTFTLTADHAASISDAELAFSSDRLLPQWSDIPAPFKQGNRYTHLAEAIFYGRPLPEFDIELRPGFTADNLNRLVRSHLGSFAPKHERKIAGVGYLIYLASVVDASSDSYGH